MPNPFTITFGKKPKQYIERIIQTKEIIDTFTDEEPSNQVYMLTGVRGCGKTVMMTSISNYLSKEKDWYCIDLNPGRDMLSSLAAKLYALPNMKKLALKAKLDLSAFGFGISIEEGYLITDVEDAIARMLEQLRKSKKRLLITIDEVIANDYVKVFTKSFQSFVRAESPIFLIMTGLYENIYELQNDKGLTFLYRAPKIVLSALNFTAVRDTYKKVLKKSDDDAREMASICKGYSYAFQILGYLCYEEKDKPIEALIPRFDQILNEYVYSKMWSELSGKDKKIVSIMARQNLTKIKDIRKACGNMSPNEFSVYRDRLTKKGLLDGSTYGELNFTLPRFDEFVKDQYF
jgi:hypothetical protein